MPKTKLKLKKGVCSACWGKKYYTQMLSYNGFGDFDNKVYQGSKIEKKSCPRCNGTGKEPRFIIKQKSIKQQISEIFVKYGLPTRQIAINEIIKLITPIK